MTLKDEAVELNVELNRTIAQNLDVVTSMELGAELIMLLPFAVTVTQLTAQDVNVNKELDLASDVNRTLEWEFEL